VAQDFIQVAIIALKKKPNATKCSDSRTISLIGYMAKMVDRIIRKTERKIEDVDGEDQFGFRRGSVTGDLIGMLRIISEQTLKIDEKVSASFTSCRRYLTM
jgi:hypothetical protein